MWHQKHEDSVCVIINVEIKMHTVLLQPLSTEGHVSLLDDVSESLACVERRLPESSHVVVYTPFHHDVAFPSTLLVIPQIRGILFHMVMTWTGMCFHTCSSIVTVLEAYHTHKMNVLMNTMVKKCMSRRPLKENITGGLIKTGL